VVPSSTQFLPLNRTESVSFHHFNQRVFQQNRPGADIAKLAVNIVRFPQKGLSSRPPGPALHSGKRLSRISWIILSRFVFEA
jgi:hypothetical protein